MFGVDDLYEKIVDVTLEGKISCQYGTFDKVPNKMHESSPYVYLHCDVLYKQGCTIIIFSLMSHWVEQHEDILKLGSYIWLENFEIFEIFSKLAKIFKKGDMFFVSFIYY